MSNTIESVLDFLRKNGLLESESALMEDIIEKSELGSVDIQSFVFPMVPPPPLLKIPITRRRWEKGIEVDYVSSSSDEFVSLDSSLTGVCSSEFTNPYGIRTINGASSQASSDRLSQFGTACDHDFDVQNDLYWDKEGDEDYDMPPFFGSSETFGDPSEDKFVMTTEKHTDNKLCLNYIRDESQLIEVTNYPDKQWPLSTFDDAREEGCNSVCYKMVKSTQVEERFEGKEGCTIFCCSNPICTCGVGGLDLTKCVSTLEQGSIKSSNYSMKRNAIYDSITHYDSHVVKKNIYPSWNGDYEAGKDREMGNIGSKNHKFAADEEGSTSNDDLLMSVANEEEYDVFDLRIIHRKNRTGFEENKDLPIVIHSIIAGRYYVTEYLGSAAFSKVVQAQDLHAGVDVCLKIIKNDKDFFDQSLDEIKLLKFVNRHDPGDERHILRLYDYFYYQEHLFIVCELLRANLYEFQKYNRESGGEPYFTLSRLQVITRQCLEALEYLHNLGIIHCDLKPENILIKSYKRCEIKVIDLGSSCFRTDNLCLYVQSRSYRAPEVILGLQYDHKIDLWSLGCILAELCSGEVLFPNDSVAMLLARMIGLLGPIDTELLVRGQETEKYFTKDYDIFHISEETNELEYIIPANSSLEEYLQFPDGGFTDFLRYLLEINPKRRPTAKEALNHPWLSYSYDLNSS